MLASLLLLPVFLGLTAYYLDRAFHHYQLDAQRDSMRLLQLLLARAAEWDGNAWRAEGLDEIRFNLLDSGLYALILDDRGQLAWSSPSAASLVEQNTRLESLRATAIGSWPALGQNRFGSCLSEPASFCYTTRLAWGSKGPESLFLVIEDQARVIAARREYRNSLLLLSLATALFLIVAQALVFGWGLNPLRRLASAIGRLERGEAEQLDGSWPPELRPLTDSVNQLLGSERRRRERVRNTMDRLTHVLKTPLMLIRNADDDPQFRPLVLEQVQRMLGIVEGELARARLDGRSVELLGTPLAVAPVLQRIVDAYGRLPAPNAKRPPLIDTGQVDADAWFDGDERDLQDLFGTLLENALKFCRQRVVVIATMESDTGGVALALAVEDDGDGIPPGQEDTVLERGARADTANLGQGLGLAIVVEIAAAYGGSVNADNSELGGARLTVRLPCGRRSRD